MVGKCTCWKLANTTNKGFCHGCCWKAGLPAHHWIDVRKIGDEEKHVGLDRDGSDRNGNTWLPLRNTQVLSVFVEVDTEIEK